MKALKSELPRSNKLEALTTLRFFAAMAIVLYHIRYLFPSIEGWCIILTVGVPDQNSGHN